MGVSKYSPTITGYGSPEGWWEKNCDPNEIHPLKDQDGYDRYGYDNNGADRAGIHENDYVHEYSYEGDCYPLVERISQLWSKVNILDKSTWPTVAQVRVGSLVPELHIEKGRDSLTIDELRIFVAKTQGLNGKLRLNHEKSDMRSDTYEFIINKD